jgi:hypothetical protein
MLIEIILCMCCRRGPSNEACNSEVFKNTQHRYCRFHVTRTWRHKLDRLYTTHKRLKVELESLFNFPLGPTEFEKAWYDTVDKYGIKEHPAVNSLWKKGNVDNDVL